MAGRRPSDRVTEPCCVLGPTPGGFGFVGVHLKANQQVGGRTVETTVLLDKPENCSGNGVCFKGYLDRLSPVRLICIEEVILGPAQSRSGRHAQYAEVRHASEADWLHFRQAL